MIGAWYTEYAALMVKKSPGYGKAQGTVIEEILQYAVLRNLHTGDFAEWNLIFIIAAQKTVIKVNHSPVCNENIGHAFTQNFVEEYMVPYQNTY